jgi:sialate O-acetylesterase
MLRIAVLICALACAASADVTLPNILAEHMVVQRGLPVHIWGNASPEEAVSVSFRGETRATKADANGRWHVYLPPGEAGGPFELKIQGANTIAFKDVLVATCGSPPGSPTWSGR